MGRRRRGVLLAAAAFTLVALSTGDALAAVQRATLSAERAPAGSPVTLRVEATARFAGAEPGTLFMVPQPALDRSPPARHCDEIAGSQAVSEMAWRMGRVTFGESTYDGYIGEATFTVPAIPAGSYYLAENSVATNAGCHPYATLEVTGGQLPDTATGGS